MNINERDRLFRMAIFDEIDAERKRLQEMGENEFDDNNNPNDWVAFVTRFVSRAADSSEQPYRSNMVQAAVTCVAAIEAYDRKQSIVARHYET